MNKERDKKLRAVVGVVQAVLEGDGVRQEVSELHAEEDDAYNNMPEGLQNGDAGQKSQDCVEKIDAVGTAMDDLLSALEELEGALDA